MLAAPGQGALGIECLAADRRVEDLVARLADPMAAACVRAERSVSRALGGSCTIPLAAFAQPEGGQLKLRALVASRDGRRIARAAATRSAAPPICRGSYPILTVWAV